MFKNDRTNFSKNTTTEEAKIILKEFETSLDKDHSNSVKLYQKICKKMRERVTQNYFKPIKQFSNFIISDPNKESYGFIVMGVNCILIEFLYQLQNEINESTDLGKVEDAYIKILPQLDKKITGNLAKKFYKGIRCGIIHQSQTKEDTAITYELESIIERNGGYYLCNPLTLLKKLEGKYKDYWKNVSEAKYNEEDGKKLVTKYKQILSHIS